MCRRIDVCSPLADVREALSKKSIALFSEPLVVPLERASLFSFGNPGHCGIPGSKACVRSTNFFETRIFWMLHKDGSPARGRRGAICVIRNAIGKIHHDLRRFLGPPFW